MNEVFLLGFTGKDAEEKMAGETLLSNFTLATKQIWRDSTGEKREKTDWHNCVAHGRIAEYLNKNLKKGTKVLVKGRIANNEWTDKHGSKHNDYNIICNNVLIL